jgi:hypothetical protein
MIAGAETGQVIVSELIDDDSDDQFRFWGLHSRQRI